MTTIAVSLDQFYRGQPGGIGTYARGLMRGLREVNEPSLRLVGIVPTGRVPADVAEMNIDLSRTGVGARLTTRVWGHLAVGVPRESAVVHATSMSGPFGGGRIGARHSVTVHDLLWRDVPDATTAAGIAFHEARLALIAKNEELSIVVTSETLAGRLVAEGVARERLIVTTLGSDDTTAPDLDAARSALAAEGVTGPFTLAVGTVEPRKNLERVVAAHRDALRDQAELGPLVVVGPTGWGQVDTGDAIRLGPVSWPVLLGLYRLARVCVYAPLAEGWGFPPVEALRAGTAVVSSTTVPSVESNPLVQKVDPRDVAALSGALVAAVTSDTEDAQAARTQSVAHLTWRACAETHLRGWR